MIRKIQHLRGNESDFREHDLIVCDGELALLRREDGSTAVKIGDGVRPFSALPFLGRTVRHEESGTVRLCHDTEHRLSLTERVDLSLPDTVPDDFFVTLTFSTPLTGATLSYPAGSILFVGDHTQDGVLIPEARYYYTLTLRYNGEIVLAQVSAVSLDLSTLLPREIRRVEGYGRIGIPAKSAEDVLEITIGGRSTEPDEWGDFFGVGEMDWEYCAPVIQLLVSNKTVCSFDTFARRIVSTYNTTSVTRSYNGGKLSYKCTGTMGTGFLTAQQAVFVPGMRYRIRMEVTKSGGTPLKVGETFDTGILVRYTDGTAVGVTKTYTGRMDGDGLQKELVEYVTDGAKVIDSITLRYTPDGATNVVRGDSFLFVADDGTDDVPAPMTQTLRYPIDDFLLHLGEVRDTLSLRSGLLTRRIRGEKGTNLACEVYDRTGNVTIYRYFLNKAAKRYSPVYMPTFKNVTYEELKTHEKCCCIDEDAYALFFTLRKTDTTVDDYWSFTDEKIPVFFYLLANEEVSTISVPELTLPDGYVAVSVPQIAAHLSADYLD